jgi:hypothetical protein
MQQLGCFPVVAAERKHITAEDPSQAESAAGVVNFWD